MEQVVNKLRIISYKTPKFEASIGGSFSGGIGGALSGAANAALNTAATIPMMFEVQINPENFQRNFTIKYNCAEVPGSLSSPQQFYQVAPDQLQLKFTIDGTGVVANSSFLPDPAQAISGAITGDDNLSYVSLKVLQLKATVFDFDGKIHRTPFLMVIWGKEIFKGTLDSLKVNYTLFHPSGIPLRAEINMSMTQETDSSLLQSIMNLLSPDLTHERTAVAGDNILTLTNRIYDTPFYYLEVAKANRLNNFRKLKPGSRMIFPPIEKNRN